jgi:hypothetical protein
MLWMLLQATQALPSPSQQQAQWAWWSLDVLIQPTSETHSAVQNMEL